MNERLDSPQHCKEGAIITTILQMRTEAQGPTPVEWQGWDTNPGSLWLQSQHFVQHFAYSSEQKWTLSVPSINSQSRGSTSKETSELEQSHLKF